MTLKMLSGGKSELEIKRLNLGSQDDQLMYSTGKEGLVNKGMAVGTEQCVGGQRETGCEGSGAVRRLERGSGTKQDLKCRRRNLD